MRTAPVLTNVFLGSVCVLLVVVAWLGWENMLRPAKIVVSPTDETVTLADAVDLLPHPENVAAGRALGNDRYWVWVETTDERKTPLEESWIVDVGAETATQISARRFGPGGGTATVSYLDNDISNQYFSVGWSGGWEGFWTKVTEYISRETGAFAFALVVNSGQTAEIVTPTETLKISYAPETLCDSVTSGNNTATEQATGLSMDGDVYPFPEPIDIECGFNDMSGQSYHESFGSFFVAHDAIRLILARGHADIPLSLDLDQMEFAGF